MTDNRTNEPSPQVKAAAMEMAIIDLPSMHSLEDRAYAREKWRRYQWEAERVLGEVAKVTPKPSAEAIAAVEVEHRYVMVAPGPHECSCGEVMPESSTSWVEAHRFHRAEVVLALVAAQGAAPQAESVPASTYISPHLPGMIRNLGKSDPSENSVRTALRLAGDLIQELIDLKADPVLPSSTVDEGRISEAIEDAIIDNLHPENTTNGFYVPFTRVGDIASVAARAVAEAVGGEGL